MQNKKLTIFFISAVTLMIFLSACSTKKNTATSRFYQSFTTRYNVYFNGSEHYKEQIKELENKYEDDYTNFLMLHPAEAYANPKAPQPSTNFNRTIEKMQKAIQLHSIKKRPIKNANKMKDPEYRKYLKRDEYNPFIHNAWFLMGKAQYMKGDFLSAAATFHYIVRHFDWMPELVLESKIWEARCYCAEGWVTEADNILSRIKPAQITNKRLRGMFSLAYADYYVKNKQWKEAIPYLAEAAKSASGGQKTRLYFLLGQLYSANGDRQLAYDAFKKAGSNSNSSYRTKFNARIKQSEVFAGKDIRGEVKSLKSMTRYDRNKEYLDQIYYAIGNLYISHNDTVHAIENYQLAVKKSTRNAIDKAIAQITLGNLYFDMHNYTDAQPCYAEAIPLLPNDYPNYELLKMRSDVLDELALYAQNVKLNDSLLVLATKTPEQQMKVAQGLVDALKKKEKEEAEAAKREEYMAQQQAQGSTLGNTTSSKAPATYTMNNDNSWYFYNTATKNAGKTAFQKQWGNRKLEDDWRRRNKASFSMNEFDNNAKEENKEVQDTAQAGEANIDATTKKHMEDPHFVEYYLKQIPKTPEEIQNCKDIVQEGLYNMGLILKDKLEDFPSAIMEFNTLLKQYPDNIYRLDVYYNMYLMYIRMKNATMAEKYRQLILSEFADSKYGQAMRDPNYIENLRNMEKDQESMYEKAYDAYLANNNTQVHESYAEMMRKYPLSKLMPKFMFIDALTYLTDKNYDKFKDILKEMLERYPETDITPTASSILRQIAKGRKLEGGSHNVRGMIWDMRLSNDSTELSPDAKLTPFEEGKDTPQYYILVFNTDSINSNQLLFEIARHNFNSFVVRDFDIEPMNFGRLGLLVIKGFTNFEELNHYKRVLEADKEFVMPSGVRPVMISEKNFNILLREGRSFEEYFNFLDEESSKKVEKDALEAPTPNEPDDGNKP